MSTLQSVQRQTLVTLLQWTAENLSRPKPKKVESKTVNAMTRFVFYPYFCLDCQLSYIAKKRNEPCRGCRSKNIISCFEE